MPTTETKFRGDGDILVTDLAAGPGTQEAFTVSGIVDSSANDLNGLYWTFSTQYHDYHVWYNQPGNNPTNQDPGNPVVNGGLGLSSIGIPVTVESSALGSVIVTTTLEALRRLGEIDPSAINASTVKITLREFASVLNASAWTTPFTVSVSTQGAFQITIPTKWVITGSGGGVADIVDRDDNTFDLHGSTYNILELNTFPVAGSNVVGSATDTAIKTDNLVLAACNWGGLGSQLGGVN